MLGVNKKLYILSVIFDSGLRVMIKLLVDKVMAVEKKLFNSGVSNRGSPEGRICVVMRAAREYSVLFVLGCRCACKGPGLNY